MIPFIRWPEGTPVVVYTDQALSVNAPPDETRFCYVTLNKKHAPTQHVCIRVVGNATSVRKMLGLKEK